MLHQALGWWWIKNGQDRPSDRRIHPWIYTSAIALTVSLVFSGGVLVLSTKVAPARGPRITALATCETP
jgi:hypothetical protein